MYTLGLGLYILVLNMLGPGLRVYTRASLYMLRLELYIVGVGL